MTSSTVPEWFSKLIGQGLASLYLLNLEGCPANDSTGRVCSLWAGALWTKRRWYPDGDPDLIRAAFVALATTCTRWPAPAKFLEHLPGRPPRKHTALMNPEFGREREPEVFAAMISQFEDYGIADRIPAHVREKAAL